ncbi:MAG: 50S ribosomal protein L4 [Clostridia bacterium]|nr:50S ribosomal protein L4 [Clostridia bacterium]MBQ3553884.1 50S ribosomal protein L4 [Clostridia bacterium]
MPNAVLYNMEGKELGNYELNAAVFGIEPNKTAIHTVVVSYLANQRQGTQSALTRAEVRGGGIKPWRQKGTGRARQGSIRSPQWTGGGVVFAPKPRDYRTSVNKKVKKLALKSALSAKVLDNEILVLDSIAVEEIKTKTIAEMLKNLKVDTKALIVLPEKDEKVYRSAKNIPGVETSFVGALNVYELLKHDKLIITKDAAEKLVEVYA